MADKIANYSDAQVAIMVAAIRDNGNVANMALAEKLAADERMNDNDKNPRKARSIVAKLRKVVDENEGFTYERKATVTKDGKPVQKKLDLVSRIATAANVPVAKLDGMEKAPKLALETLVAALAA